MTMHLIVNNRIAQRNHFCGFAPDDGLAAHEEVLMPTPTPQPKQQKPKPKDTIRPCGREVLIPILESQTKGGKNA